MSWAGLLHYVCTVFSSLNTQLLHVPMETRSDCFKSSTTFKKSPSFTTYKQSFVLFTVMLGKAWNDAWNTNPITEGQMYHIFSSFQTTLLLKQPIFPSSPVIPTSPIIYFDQKLQAPHLFLSSLVFQTQKYLFNSLGAQHQVIFQNEWFLCNWANGRMDRQTNEITGVNS